MGAIQLALLFSFVPLAWTQSCSLDALTTSTTMAHYDIIKGTGPYREGEVVPYTCQPGHRQTSPPPKYRNATCRGGRWEYTSESLICAPVNCGHPGTVRHAFLEGSVFTFPNSVRFKCNQGYIFTTKGASKTLYCQSDGKWSPEDLPICETVNCGPPATIAHCSQEGSDHTYQETVKYNSDQGYSINGADTLTCESDGKWHPSPPICERVSCGPPPTVTHGSREGNDFTFPNSVRYKCEEGYTMRGTDRVVCESNGNWHPSPPVCESTTKKETVGVSSTAKMNSTAAPRSPARNPCSQLYAPNNGELVSNGTTDTVAMFACNEGYVMRGSSTLVCQLGGTWDPLQPPTCEAPFPWVIVVGVVAAVLVTGVTAVVFLLCRRRFTNYRSEIRKPSASNTHTQSEVAHLHNPTCPTTSL